MSDRIAYCPCNGTEGEIFMAKWCAHCVKDQSPVDGEPCEIVMWTMALLPSDPCYPVEWREDGPAGPRCTAFQALDELYAREPLDPSAVIRNLI